MEKRIYSCATAHLDTIWNWDFEHTVSTCLYNTLYNNFKLFKKYPDYKFNFEGSYRYELFEEYYPEAFEILKKYIADGRWNVTGSAYENGDVNVPSPEALFRNILYGNGYFYKKFGKRSKEIFLPDCFGFGYALPSIINHSNLLGFTTQKLTWGSAYGTPFDIGFWQGVNGKSCYACLNPDSYSLSYKNIRNKKDNVKKLKENEQKYNLPWTFSFHGTGDQGGSPKECSVKVLQKEIDQNYKKDVKVLSVRSDQIYDDLNNLTKEQKNKLPVWNNELVMRDHGAGGYTSRAIGKRWNRRCEELCDMTERSATLGTLIGGMDYPKVQLEKSWKRVIAHQFHDDLPGTSVARGYQRSWNDYVLSLNQLEKEYAHSVGVVANAMDTSWVKGTPVVVNNSAEFDRTDVVKIYFPLSKNDKLVAKDKNGKIYPVQILKHSGEKSVATFVCTISSLGYKVFDLQVCNKTPRFKSTVKATNNSLQNENLIVTFNENGEISQIYDKNLKKELLKNPIRHQLIEYDGSIMWPAWELTYKSICSNKIHYPKLRSMRVIHQGPVTAAIGIIQTYGKSVFRTVVSLDSGGTAVKVQNEIEWWEQKTLLKDAFSLSVSNKKATYDLGLGVIERESNSEKLFEVPAQKWANISNDDFGISIISDCKYGWDKPNDNTLRMTVLHTPKRNFQVDSMQSLMEVGLNRYGYEIFAHNNDFNKTQKLAKSFNQPFNAVETSFHKGVLSDEYSFATLSKNNVILRALKQSEDSDEIIVRFNEGSNKNTKNIHFKIGNGIESAKEVYASEEVIGDAIVLNEELVFDLDAYDVKSFSLKLKPFDKTIEKPSQTQIDLDCNNAIFTENKKGAKPVVKKFNKLTLPKEIAPKTITYNGLNFNLDDEKAVCCQGQLIKLDKKYSTLSILAFSKKGDRSVSFFKDKKVLNKIIHSAYERIGVWDLFSEKDVANIKECDLAYEFTHAHNENGQDVVAKQTLVFCYTFDVNGVDEFELPYDKNIIVLSATAKKDNSVTKLMYPMYDRVSNRKFQNNFNIKNRLICAVGKLPYNAVPVRHHVRRSDKYKVK